MDIVHTRSIPLLVPTNHLSTFQLRFTVPLPTRNIIVQILYAGESLRRLLIGWISGPSTLFDAVMSRTPRRPFSHLVRSATWQHYDSVGVHTVDDTRLYLCLLNHAVE
jgi:hypothetical protein